MSEEVPPLPPPPPPIAPEPPTPAEVLRAVAAVSPALWFPSEHARQTGAPRDGLDEPVMVLRQSGLIQVVDWEKGRGQGHGLTALGREVLADDAKLTSLREGKLAPAEPAADDADLVAHPAPATPEPEEAKKPAEPPALTPYERGEQAREAFLSVRPSLVTPMLLYLSITWFLVGLYLAGSDTFAAKEYLRGLDVLTPLQLGAAFGPRLLAGEWWRLGSAGFVHFGLLHLAGNMLALAMLGPFAENLLSRWRFLAVYLLAGVVGSAAAVLNNPQVVIAGASASNWGMMLAVIGWILRYREHLPPQDVASVVRTLGYVVLLNAVVSFAPGISWEGHFAGGVTGFLAAGLLDMTRRDQGRRRRVLGVVGLVAFLVLCVAGFVAVVKYSEKWRFMRVVPHFIWSKEHGLQLQVLPENVGAERIQAVHKTATFALTNRQPNGLKDLSDSVDQLDGAAAVLTNHASERDAAYLAKVREFAALLRTLHAAEGMPTVEQWNALGAKRDELVREWNGIQGK